MSLYFITIWVFSDKSASECSMSILQDDIRQKLLHDITFFYILFYRLGMFWLVGIDKKFWYPNHHRHLPNGSFISGWHGRPLSSSFMKSILWGVQIAAAPWRSLPLLTATASPRWSREFCGTANCGARISSGRRQPRRFQPSGNRATTRHTSTWFAPETADIPKTALRELCSLPGNSLTLRQKSMIFGL